MIVIAIVIVIANVNKTEIIIVILSGIVIESYESNLSVCVLNSQFSDWKFKT